MHFSKILSPNISKGEAKLGHKQDTLTLRDLYSQPRTLRHFQNNSTNPIGRLRCEKITSYMKITYVCKVVKDSLNHYCAYI